MKKTILKFLVITLLAQSYSFAVFAQEKWDQKAVQVVPTTDFSIDDFNKGYTDIEDKNLDGMSDEEYQKQIDIMESNGDVLRPQPFSPIMPQEKSLTPAEQIDATLKNIGAVNNVNDLQLEANRQIKNTGAWAMHFVYIKKDGTRQSLTTHRIHESIKPASTLKIFSSYLAYTNQTYPLKAMSIMLHKSDNVMADAALRSVAKKYKYVEIEKNGIDELINGGVAIMKKTFSGLEDITKLNAVNGSGLNTTGVDTGLKLNKVSARLETALLEKIYKSGNYNEYKKLLAQPGQFGTLKTRLGATNRLGKIYAKTGTLASTKALAGFVDTKNGVLVFAMIGDELRVGAQSAANIQDNILFQHVKYLTSRGL